MATRMGAPSRQNGAAVDYDLRFLNRILHRAQENTTRDPGKNAAIIRHLAEVIRIYQDEHVDRTLSAVPPIKSASKRRKSA